MHDVFNINPIKNIFNLTVRSTDQNSHLKAKMQGRWNSFIIFLQGFCLNKQLNRNFSLQERSWIFERAAPSIVAQLGKLLSRFRPNTMSERPVERFEIRYMHVSFRTLETTYMTIERDSGFAYVLGDSIPMELSRAISTSTIASSCLPSSVSDCRSSIPAADLLTLQS